MSWKVTAVCLTVTALLFGAGVPGAAGPSPDDQALASAAQQHACGVLPSNGHGKRTLPLRGVLAAGTTKLRLPVPAERFTPVTIAIQGAPTRIATHGAGIRAPPNA